MKPSKDTNLKSTAVAVLGAFFHLACSGGEAAPVDATAAFDAPIPDAAVDAAPDARPCLVETDLDYVLSALDIPANAAAAAGIALDLDDDGLSDNALGGLLGALSTIAELDVASDEALRRGTMIQLFAIDAASVDTADPASIRFFTGENSCTEPCSNSSDTQCGKHLQGSPTFDVAIDSPTDYSVSGTIASGTFETPISAQNSAFLSIAFSESTPIVLPLAFARVEVDTSSAALMTGTLAGGVSGNNIDTILLPALVDYFAEVLSASCSPSGADCGCPSGSSADKVLNFFDANEDCQVPLQELKDNTLMDATLRNPDLDLLDAGGALELNSDGVDDHLSVALGFSAVHASFTAP